MSARPPRPIHAAATLVICAAVLLTACTPYQPTPVDPTALAQTYDAAELGLPSDATISEADALALAIERSPQIHQAATAYSSALAAARTARVRPAMTLNLTGEYSRQADPQHPWLFGGAVDIPLSGGGRRDAQLTTADLQVLQARFAYADALWRVRDALHRAVAERALAGRELSIAQRQLDILDERVAVAERRVVAGEDDRLVALQAASLRAGARQRVSASQAVIRSADAAIAAALSVPVERLSGVSVTPSFDLETIPTADAVEAMRLDAATARSDVLRAVVDYDIAEEAVRSAVAGQYPSVTLSPGYTWERGVTKLPFGLSLALPPADLNRSAIAEAEARRAEAGRALEASQATVFAEVDAAAVNLASAGADIERLLAQDTQDAARTLRVTERALELGASDRGELLAARAASLDVDLAIIDAQRRRNTALADLELAARQSQDTLTMTIIARAMSQLEPGS